ncbi:MAG: BrnA antitoxin family protein [Hypericibacter sp.]
MRSRGETATAANAPTREVDAAFWATAQLIAPDRRKVHTGLRIDADVLDWFKAKGRGWQTRMNAVLRSYYEHERRS